MPDKQKIKQKIKKILVFLPAAPILVSTAFALNVYQNNFTELEISALKWPLITTLIVSIIFTLIIKLILRDRQKSQFFATLFSIMFFCYEALVFSVLFVLNKINLQNISSSQFFFATWSIVVIAIFIFTKKTSRNLSRINKFLTIMALIAVVIPSFLIIKEEVTRFMHPAVKSTLTLPKASSLKLNKHDLPDIYLIMPEDYSSQATLKKYFNFDDTGFTDFLKQKGFYIASDATSNYPKTFLSLASMFNMEYLNFLSVNKNSNDQTIPDKLIEENNVVKFLKSAGYNYYQMGSWWPETARNRLATQNLILQGKNALNLDQLTYTILDASAMRPFINRFFAQTTFHYSDQGLRNIVLYQFATVKDVVKKPSPKYVFVHIISPHAPYVFDKNCQSVEVGDVEGQKEQASYLNQTTCINQKIETAINEILTLSPKPPVILLQTDEGAPFLSKKLDPQDSWGKASPQLLQEKFPIFAAYYLPNVTNTMLYSSITPVNSFRVILDDYLHLNLPLLPDKNYIFPDLNDLYNFKDVTSIVRSK